MKSISANLNIMIKAAEKASKALIRDFGEIENLQVSPSSIARFVANTENKIERSLIEDLTKARPDWQFKRKTDEETSENKYYWIIDTLNGKTNFAHAFPYFSISIAVEYNNEIICTVILDPLRDEIYFAEKGKGSFQNDRRIRVSNRKSINNCIFSIYNDQNLDYNSSAINDLKIMKELALQNSSVTREFGSSALNYAWLASGKIDCLFTTNLNKNQVACGELLIKEAGGYISNLKYINAYMAPDNLHIGANPVIHKELLKKINNLKK